MASAARLGASLEERGLRGRRAIAAAGTADERLAAHLGYLRSLAAVVRAFDAAKADKVIDDAVDAVRGVVGDMEQAITDQIRALRDEREAI